ncbi:hypothetical protein EJB05_38927, partial [Eragrostis curvula]
AEKSVAQLRRKKEALRRPRSLSGTSIWRRAGDGFGAGGSLISQRQPNKRKAPCSGLSPSEVAAEYRAAPLLPPPDLRSSSSIPCFARLLRVCTYELLVVFLASQASPRFPSGKQASNIDFYYRLGLTKYKNMSYFQATTHRPHGVLIAHRPVAGLGKARELLHRDSLCPNTTRSCKLQEQVYPRLVLVSACHKRLGPLYALSGKENPDPFSMESLNKAMSEAKRQRPIKDLLMEQIAKLRGQGSGGNGGNRNRYGGDGGGSDGPDDESFKDSFYELIQILLATVAFILLYIHIIRGEELYRLARDYTRYLVTGKRTARLKRAMMNWRDFCESITKKDSAQEDYDGRTIASESTWRQLPQKFVHRLEEMCRGYLRPQAQES